MSHSEDTAGWGPLEAPLPKERATWFGELCQTDFDIEFFEQIVIRNPNRVQVLRLLGELLARKGFYDRSLLIDRHLVRLLPNDPLARYNLACSLAMCGHGAEAILELRESVAQGYNDFGYMEMDSDLDSLRQDPDFQRILNKRKRTKRSPKKRKPD